MAGKGSKTNKRVNEKTSDEQKPRGKSNPESYSSQDLKAPDGSDPVSSTNDQAETRPGALAKKFITAMRKMRRLGMTIEEIARFFELSTATVWKHVHDVVVEAKQTLRESSTISSQPNGVAEAIEPPRIPRLASEIVTTTSDRPEIVEANEGSGNVDQSEIITYHRAPMHTNNGSSFNSIISHESAFTLAGQMALDKYTDVNLWIKERMVSRLDNERYVRAWIDDGTMSDEEFLENLKGIMLDGRAYRERETRWDREFREKNMREEEERRNKP